MSYTPTTDFLALLRLTSNGERLASVPGLDYTVSALARAGLIGLSVGQTAPTTNQAATAWFKPMLPSWTAEGTLFLWNAITLQYEIATPALWAAMLSPSSTVFQSVPGAAAAVGTLTTLLAIQRVAPAATVLTLPAVASRAGKDVHIIDWSSAVANHAISLVPFGTETIMKLPAFTITSTADQLAGVTLRPSTDLNGWVITP